MLQNIRTLLWAGVLLPTLALFSAAFVPSTAAAQASPSQTAESEPVPTPQLPQIFPFGPGEELNFAVKFGVVRAGNASLAVRGMERMDDEVILRLESTATSARFFSTFYKVDNLYQSFWSLADAQPVASARRVREGSYKKDERITFDSARGLAIDQDGKEHPILPGCQDAIGAFYYLRAVPLEIGGVVRIPHYSNGKSYVLHVNVLRRESVTVPAGRFDCIVVEPKLEAEGVFQQKGTLTVWLTDDPRRMPVLMRSKIAVGSIEAELETFRPGTPLRRPGAGKL